jgi:membrane glycosyltransferase
MAHISATKRTALELTAVSITAIAAVGYVLGGFTYGGNLWWVLVCTLLYAWLARPIVDLYLCVAVCLFSRPRILPATAFPPEGIPPDHKTALVYCVRATSEHAIAQALESLEVSLAGNASPSLYAIYLSDTENAALVAREIDLVQDSQRRFGRTKVIYMHRTVNWGRKWGAYQDLMLWLHRGSTRAETYLDPKYGRLSRDPCLPLFSLSFMGEGGRSVMATDAELASGMVGDIAELRSPDSPPVQYMVVSDADVRWEPGSLLLLAGIMANPANSAYSIFQPHVRILNESASVYARMLAVGREFSEFVQLAVWKANDAFFFFGKGGIRIDDYIRVMLRPGEEVLFPQALSHDFLEASYLRTAYVPHIHVVENAPSSYIEDLERMQRWLIGDLLVIWHRRTLPRLAALRRLITRRQRVEGQEGPQPEMLFVMQAPVRFAFSSSAFALFLILRLVGGSVAGLYTPGSVGAELASFSFALFGVLLLPRFVGPIAASVHLGKHNGREIGRIVLGSLPELVLSTLIFLQQLFDRNVALVKATWSIWSASRDRRQLDWTTSQQAEGKEGGTTYCQVYRRRLGIVTVGLATWVGVYLSQPVSTMWFTLPITLSFVLGPALSKATGLRAARHGRTT